MNTDDDNVKQLIEQHLNHVEQHYNRIHNTLQQYENTVSSQVNEQTWRHTYEELNQTPLQQDTDVKYWNQLNTLFGIQEKTNIDVTFLNTNVMEHLVDDFNEETMKNIPKALAVNRGITDETFIVEQAKRLNPALFENEDGLYEYFTQSWNVDHRDRLMRFSTFAERLKVTHPQYYMPNDPLYETDTTSGYKCLMHRLLVDIPKRGLSGMYGSLKTMYVSSER
jgi:hypothetical protein